MNDLARDLNRRTPGEELWLWRRRQLSASPRRTTGRPGSGMSQAEAAAHLGVPVTKYHDAETDKAPEREVRLLLALAGAETGSEPSRGELCALARRRSGMTLLVAAQSVDVSRVTYLELERSGAPDVVDLWGRVSGFIF